MKKYTIIGLLCFTALAGLFTITKSPAQGNPHQLHAVIIFGATSTLGPVVQMGQGWGRPQIGMEVTWVSRSENAPQINTGASLSETLAYLLNQGFRLEPQVNYAHFMLTR